MWRCDEDDDCSDNSDEDDCREWPAGEEGNGRGGGWCRPPAWTSLPGSCPGAFFLRVGWLLATQRELGGQRVLLGSGAEPGAGVAQAEGAVRPGCRAGTVGRDAIVPASV